MPLKNSATHPPLEPLRGISLRPKSVINSKLARTLLLSWQEALRRYCAAFKWNECPWWYSERPGVSTLSGAVWLMKGIVLEEFKVQKDREDGAVNYGRCDLYFGLPSAGSYSHFDAECKHCSVKLHESFDVGLERLNACLKDARKDAKKLPQNGGSTRLGIVFVTFCTRKNHEYNSREELRKWTNGLKNTRLKCSAAAWFFLKGKRHSECPGTALLIAKA
jgi:hypothetical protein